MTEIIDRWKAGMDGSEPDEGGVCKNCKNTTFHRTKMGVRVKHQEWKAGVRQERIAVHITSTLQCTKCNRFRLTDYPPVRLAPGEALNIFLNRTEGDEFETRKQNPTPGYEGLDQ